MYATAPKITFTVLGDSAAFGTGDSDADGNCRGWAYYLSQVFREEVTYLNFSRPGAKSSEVREDQLPRAIASEPDICAVIAGGNDLLRNGFNPQLLYTNLRQTCDQLMSRGAEILMIELHDPNQLLHLPRLLKRVLARRVNSVNEVYYRVAEELDLLLIRTRQIPDVHNKENWHIDRMHPGPLGHQILARAMADKLKARGWALNIPEIQRPPLVSKGSQRIWLIKNGLPWFLKRSVDLLPAALILMAFEICLISREKFQRLFLSN
jgi:lysophospholipase L1-like esterase